MINNYHMGTKLVLMAAMRAKDAPQSIFLTAFAQVATNMLGIAINETMFVMAVRDAAASVVYYPEGKKSDEAATLQKKWEVEIYGYVKRHAGINLPEEMNWTAETDLFFYERSKGA